MSEWWIDSSLPSVDTDWLADYSIQSASECSVFETLDPPGYVWYWKDVSGDNVAGWKIGDRIFSNGDYVGRLVGIEKQLKYVPVNTMGGYVQTHVEVVSYEVRTKITAVEMEQENKWNQRHSQPRLFRLPGRA